MSKEPTKILSKEEKEKRDAIRNNVKMAVSNNSDLTQFFPPNYNDIKNDIKSGTLSTENATKLHEHFRGMGRSPEITKLIENFVQDVNREISGDLSLLHKFTKTMLNVETEETKGSRDQYLRNNSLPRMALQFECKVNGFGKEISDVAKSSIGEISTTEKKKFKKAVNELVMPEFIQDHYKEVIRPFFKKENKQSNEKNVDPKKSQTNFQLETTIKKEATFAVLFNTISAMTLNELGKEEKTVAAKKITAFNNNFDVKKIDENIIDKKLQGTYKQNIFARAFDAIKEQVLKTIDTIKQGVKNLRNTLDFTKAPMDSSKDEGYGETKGLDGKKQTKNIGSKIISTEQTKEQEPIKKDTKEIKGLIENLNNPKKFQNTKPTEGLEPNKIKIGINRKQNTKYQGR